MKADFRGKWSQMNRAHLHKEMLRTVKQSVGINKSQHFFLARHRGKVPWFPAHITEMRELDKDNLVEIMVCHDVWREQMKRQSHAATENDLVKRGVMELTHEQDWVRKCKCGFVR